MTSGTLYRLLGSIYQQITIAIVGIRLEQVQQVQAVQLDTQDLLVPKVYRVILG